MRLQSKNGMEMAETPHVGTINSLIRQCSVQVIENGLVACLLKSI